MLKVGSSACSGKRRRTTLLLADEVADPTRRKLQFPRVLMRLRRHIVVSILVVVVSIPVALTGRLPAADLRVYR
jgi:hypothetical protein